MLTHISRSVFIILALIFCAATANAENEGRVLFTKSSDGSFIYGGIDQYGDFAPLSSGKNSYFVGETALVATDSGVLSYSNLTGKGYFYLPDNILIRLANTVPFNLSPGWGIIQGQGNFLFFYDYGHTGAIVGTNFDGTIKQTYSTNSFSYWSHIIATDNYLFFYEYGTGQTATGAILQSGSFFQTAATVRPTAYTVVASVGDNLLLYNGQSGAWESGYIALGQGYNSAYYPTQLGTLPLGYTLSARLNQYLLLYNPTTGAAVIGTFNRVGQYTLTEKTSLKNGWTNIVRCGQRLMFYNYFSGAAEIGYIDNNGAYQSTQTLSIGAGYGSVVSTKQ
jgi:hypothetical protein